jgi:MATE family multidrug resistance protein
LKETKTIVSLALPMMGAQAGLMTMGVVDTLVVGRVSSLEMSGVALGNSIAGVIVVFGIGLGMGIEPLVSQALGAGDRIRAREHMWQGVYLCMLASIPLALLTALATLVLEPFGVPADIAEVASDFLWSRVPSVFATCLFSSLRSYLTSIGQPRPIVIAVVVANVFNVFADLILVFGWFGLPAMGGVGAGLATSASYGLMALILAYGVRNMRLDGVNKKLNTRDMMRIVKLGGPIGLQISTEVSIFTFVSALIARFGVVALAGHQIALTLASLSFMGAVGLANATTARVGYWIGANDTKQARRSGLIGIALGGGFMGVCGVFYAFAREPLASLFAPNDPAAAAFGAKLLLIAAAFSVCDGMQAVSAGALRGAGDTKWTFYANAIGHWFVAFPLALWLGHTLELGAPGYWWALTVGLTGVAAILILRFLRLSSRTIARVEA